MRPCSSAIGRTVFAALNAFVDKHGSGMCFPGNTGFLLPGLGDTVRSPDASFVSAAKLPAGGIGTGWVAAAPDLVVEVLSPTETASELETKLRDYFVSGTRMAWIVDPVSRIVSVRSATDGEQFLSAEEMLDGGTVLRGFALPIARLFVRLAK